MHEATNQTRLVASSRCRGPGQPAVTFRSGSQHPGRPSTNLGFGQGQPRFVFHPRPGPPEADSDRVGMDHRDDAVGRVIMRRARQPRTCSHQSAVRAAYDTVASTYAAMLPDTRAEAPLDLAMVDAFITAVRGQGHEGADHPGDGAPVLDAGCGTGRMSRHLADRGCAVRGIDLSPGMVARHDCPSPTCRSRSASLTALPFDDATSPGCCSGTRPSTRLPTASRRSTPRSRGSCGRAATCSSGSRAATACVTSWATAGTATTSPSTGTSSAPTRWRHHLAARRPHRGWRVCSVQPWPPSVTVSQWSSRAVRPPPNARRLRRGSGRAGRGLGGPGPAPRRERHEAEAGGGPAGTTGANWLLRDDDGYRASRKGVVPNRRVDTLTPGSGAAGHRI